MVDNKLMLTYFNANYFVDTNYMRCVILSVGRLRRRLRVSPTMVGGDGTTPVVLGRRLADDRCR